MFDPRFPFHPTKRIYYGYVVIIGAILVMLVSAPGQTIGISVFTDYFIKSLDITRTQLSVVYMIGGVASAFFLTSVGTLLDKKGARFVAFWTSIGLGITLVALSHMDYLVNHWVPQSYRRTVVLILLGIGLFFLRLAGVGILTVTGRTVILKWFVVARGRVSGIVGIFATLAVSASPPVFNKLIHFWGWRDTYLALGIIIGVFFSALFWLFLRDTPESCGLVPDGPLFTKKYSMDALPAERNWTLQEALRTKSFWIFLLGFNLYSFIVTAVTFHITSIFQLAGLSRNSALSVFIPSSLVAIITKVISGYLCDHPFWKDRLKYQLGFYTVSIITFCVGVFFLPVSSAAYYILFISLGIATGLYITLSSVCWGAFFGRLHVGRIGAYTTSYTVFVAGFGPMVYSLLYKITGNYHPALYLSLGMAVVLFVLSFFANKPLPPVAP